MFDEIQLYLSFMQFCTSILSLLYTKKIVCRKAKFQAKPSVLMEGFCELLKINFVAEVE